MLTPVPRSGLWLLLGAFALLGLFAMHGLGGHGAQHGAQTGAYTGGHHEAVVSPAHHHEDLAASTVRASTVTAEDPGHARPEVSANLSVGHVQDHVHAGCPPGHCTGDTTGHGGEGRGGTDGLVLILCLAVLAASFAVALFVVLLRPSVVAAVRPLAALATLARFARDRDPPCLFDLSVQRC